MEWANRLRDSRRDRSVPWLHDVSCHGADADVYAGDTTDAEWHGQTVAAEAGRVWWPIQRWRVLPGSDMRDRITAASRATASAATVAATTVAATVATAAVATADATTLATTAFATAAVSACTPATTAISPSITTTAITAAVAAAAVAAAVTATSERTAGYHCVGR